MKNIQFKRFTQPDVLGAIRVPHLAQFFDQFKSGLMPAQLPAAHHPPGTPGFYEVWIQTLSSPETLPEAFVEAILAIEQLAALENRPLLEATVREARIAHPWLDPAESPECLALQLWLLAPYQRACAEPASSPPITDPRSTTDARSTIPAASPGAPLGP